MINGRRWEDQEPPPCPRIPLPVPSHTASQAKWQQPPPSTLTFKTSAMLSSCGPCRLPHVPPPSQAPSPQPSCCQTAVNKYAQINCSNKNDIVDDESATRVGDRLKKACICLSGTRVPQKWNIYLRKERMHRVRDKWPSVSSRLVWAILGWYLDVKADNTQS